jgi:hypothetical protein
MHARILQEVTMKKPAANRHVDAQDEPMGIVISRGSRAEAEPRFSAYVWGPVPEQALTPEEVAVLTH